MDRLGVICTPGSYTGAYSAGFLKALEKCGISPDVFQGSSVGTLNFSGYVSMGIDGLIDVWRYIENCGPEFLYSDDSTLGLVRDLAKNRPLYDRQGLQNLIDMGVCGEKIVNHSSEFRVIVFNEDAQRIEVVSSSEERFKRNPKLFERFVLASCSVPGVFPPVDIEGTVYSDAIFFSVTDLVYQGCDTVFVLFNDPDNVAMDTRRADITSWWLQRVIGRRENYRDYVEYIRQDLKRHRDKCVFFRVKERILSSNDFEQGDISRAMEAGYERGLEILSSMDI